jgi:hypothetical protein
VVVLPSSTSLAFCLLPTQKGTGTDRKRTAWTRPARAAPTRPFSAQAGSRQNPEWPGFPLA